MQRRTFSLSAPSSMEVDITGIMFLLLQVPVAEQFQVRVYGRSLAGIAGSNPAGGMDGCPL